MSLRCRTSLLALALVLALSRMPAGAAAPVGQSAGPFPADGGQFGYDLPRRIARPPARKRAVAFEGNAAAIAKGQQLYTWMNCVGRHSHGGGGMGPPLMDDKWRYGGRIDQIAASIYQGRPNGMPTWRYKLTEEQIWQLAPTSGRCRAKCPRTPSARGPTP